MMKTSPDIMKVVRDSLYNGLKIFRKSTTNNILKLKG